jgi:hypothetical protein
MNLCDILLYTGEPAIAAAHAQRAAYLLYGGEHLRLHAAALSVLALARLADGDCAAAEAAVAVTPGGGIGRRPRPRCRPCPVAASAASGRPAARPQGARRACGGDALPAVRPGKRPCRE